MNWFDWVLIVFYVLEAIITPLNVDRPRDVITSERAAVVVAICILMILGIIFF